MRVGRPPRDGVSSMPSSCPGSSCPGGASPCGGQRPSVMPHNYDYLLGSEKRQRTAALQDARALSNVPNLAKRLGVRLSSAALAGNCGRRQRGAEITTLAYVRT